MTAPAWGGWSVVSAEGGRGRVAVHVGPLPGRKSIAVYTVTTFAEGGAVINVHAYCRSVEEGQALLAALDLLARA